MVSSINCEFPLVPVVGRVRLFFTKIAWSETVELCMKGAA